MKRNTLFAHIAVVLVSLQIVLIPLSWVVSAAIPERDYHSLLSDDGIRWMIGSLANNLAAPLMVWIMMWAVAIGAFKKSGLLSALRDILHLNYRQRLALKLVAAEVVIFLVIMILLTMLPHAVILNVTGSLFPSSLSSGLIPLLALLLCFLAFSYALSVRQSGSVNDVFELFTYGLQVAAPLLIDCMLAIELYYSILFVL